MKQAIINILLIIVSAVIVSTVVLFVLYYPVIGRLVDPCKYYPNAFTDCNIKNN